MKRSVRLYNCVLKGPWRNRIFPGYSSCLASWTSWRGVVPEMRLRVAVSQLDLRLIRNPMARTWTRVHVVNLTRPMSMYHLQLYTQTQGCPQTFHPREVLACVHSMNACARLYEMPRTLFHPTIAAQFLSAPIVSAALVQSTNIVNLLMCLAMTEPVTPSTLGRRLSHCAIQIW